MYDSGIASLTSYCFFLRMIRNDAQKRQGTYKASSCKRCLRVERISFYNLLVIAMFSQSMEMTWVLSYDFCHRAFDGNQHLNHSCPHDSDNMNALWHHHATLNIMKERFFLPLLQHSIKNTHVEHGGAKKTSPCFLQLRTSSQVPTNSRTKKQLANCKWQVIPCDVLDLFCQDTAASTARNPTVRRKLWFLLKFTWMWSHQSTWIEHILVNKILVVWGICTWSILMNKKQL